MPYSSRDISAMSGLHSAKGKLNLTPATNPKSHRAAQELTTNGHSEQSEESPHFALRATKACGYARRVPHPFAAPPAKGWVFAREREPVLLKGTASEPARAKSNGCRP